MAAWLKAGLLGVNSLTQLITHHWELPIKVKFSF